MVIKDYNYSPFEIESYDSKTLLKSMLFISRWIRFSCQE